MNNRALGEAPPSPFHRGERAIQERLGVRQKIEGFAAIAVRDHFPEQHREFYATLPFLLLGAVDREGWPRASILSGQPGFITTPDARTMRIEAEPLPADPIASALVAGAPVGGLGIGFGSRRRNRFTGHLTEIGEALVIALDQSFGNCPQYIQTRAPIFKRDPKDHAGLAGAERLDGLDREARALIEVADTFFIATAASDEGDPIRQGADVSHRGGRPGFVRVDGDGNLTFPDFAGNLHYNTLGNLAINPRTGLLFIDFESGDLLSVAGIARIEFDSEEIANFRGAERLVHVVVDHVVRLRAALPARFEFGEFSPNSLMTGTWAETEVRLAAERDRNRWKAHRIRRIVDESRSVRSFWLEPVEGGIAKFEAGQHLPLRLSVEGEAKPLIRTYTVSNAPADDAYRISVKREAAGQVSRYLHDHLRVGDLVEAMAPRGTFKADLASSRSVVLVAGGIGVTPMRAMLEAFSLENRRTRGKRPIYFVHAARNAEDRAFAEEMRALAALDPNIRLVFVASAPLDTELAGEDYHYAGRITAELFKSILPFDAYDFYLCGPAPMMQAIYDGLRDLGVGDALLHAEAFGPSSLRRRRGDDAAGSAEAVDAESEVHFAKSGITANWTPTSGTLLDLAESAGLAPAFGCRSGSCGTCAVRLNSGRTRYLNPPAAEVEKDHILVCSAVPDGNATEGPLSIEL